VGGEDEDSSVAVYNSKVFGKYLLMKRVLFIDFSYHSKTGSSQFLIDLLRARYSVDAVTDLGWKNHAGPDPRQINRKNYDAVIFWEISTRDIEPYLVCKNVVFFPMYDSYEESYLPAIRAAPDIGVVSFCRGLYEQLAGLSNGRMYIQYYPRPSPCFLENEDFKGLFFWQRTLDITWDTVRCLMGDENRVGSVHLHRAVDPGAVWRKPSEDDEKKYSITYSDWFATKEEYQAKVAEHALYVSPRRKEGIGMSFLEALSMGKAIIAHDDGTMNEYIVHGENGYLFNCDRPTALDLSDIRRVRRNAYDSARAGWEAWENDKYRILDFIESRMPGLPGAILPSKHRVRSANALYSVHRLYRLAERMVRNIAKALIPRGLYKSIKVKRHEVRKSDGPGRVD
jgi:glycosyltransferase involved in cell wall biosynthesis